MDKKGTEQKFYLEESWMKEVPQNVLNLSPLGFCFCFPVLGIEHRGTLPLDYIPSPFFVLFCFELKMSLFFSL